MNDVIVNDLYKYACSVSCAAVRIYNFIREVGRGELTADNALHQLVEDYRNLRSLSNDIINLADELKKEGR